MNIFEIIAEADTKPKVVKDPSTGKFTVQMPDGRKVGSYDSQKAAMDDMSKRPAIFKKVPKTPGQATAQTTKIVGKKSVRKLLKYLKDRNDPSWRALGEKSAAKRLGGFLKVLKIFGYSEMIIDYWSNISGLDEYYETNNLPKDQDYFDTQGNLISVLAVQIAASGLITSIVRSIVGLKWLFRALGLGATIGTGGFAGGAAIAGILASEVVLIAVQQYLNRPDVRETIGNVLAYKVAGISLDDPGSAAAKYWNKLKDGISKTIDEAMGKSKPADAKPNQGQGPRPAPDSSANRQTPADPRRRSDQPAPSGEPGRYSQYTTDPELKAALQAQGL